MKKKNSYQLFMEEAAAVFNGLIGSLQGNGLDNKTMRLIYIGIKASQGCAGEAAVVAHVPMAKQAGATWEEIKGAILLTLTVSRVSGVLSCLPAALEAYGEKRIIMSLIKDWNPKQAKLKEAVYKRSEQIQRQNPFTGSSMSFVKISHSPKTAPPKAARSGRR